MINCARVIDAANVLKLTLVADNIFECNTSAIIMYYTGCLVLIDPRKCLQNYCILLYITAYLCTCISFEKAFQMKLILFQGEHFISVGVPSRFQSDISFFNKTRHFYYTPFDAVCNSRQKKKKKYRATLKGPTDD